MKTDFMMQLYENDKNKQKAKCMGAIEIMFDDMDNCVPDIWNTLNGDPGIDIPWGSEFKFTIEVLENKVQDSIEKKIEKYVEEGNMIKKEFETVISDRDLSLDYRWRLFSTAPKSLKNHESWLHQFSAELLLPEKEILWMDTFYYDRYTTIDTTSWMDRLDGKKGWTDDIVNTFKEEILAKNLGSFVNDW